jgi:hypothetical protein
VLGGKTVLQQGALHNSAIGRNLLKAHKAESHGPTLVRRWCHSFTWLSPVPSMR